MRSSTWRLEDLRNVILNLGFVGENLHTRQIFDCKKIFDQYQNASVSMTVTPPEGEPYPGTIERDGDMVIWDVRDSDLVAEGDGEIQLVFTQAPHIARSYNARTHICRSQVPTGSIPSGLDDYITRADQLLDEVKDTFPAGGTTGQVLAKKSDADYDTEWVPKEAGGTEDYDELENRPQIGGVTLTGNKTLHDLGAASEGDVDAKYTKPTGGIPASDIADGVIPDPEDLIDDTAGSGDTDKVWSADKSAAETSALLTEINSAIDYNALLTEGKYIYYVNGNENAFSGYQFITLGVIPGMKINYNAVIATPGNVGLAFYDSDGVFISGYRMLTTKQTITVPANAIIMKATVWEKNDVTVAFVNNMVSAVNANKVTIQKVIGNYIIEVTEKGKYIDLSGSTADISSPSENSSYSYCLVPCSAGEEFTINARGSSTARAWGFINSSGSILDVEKASPSAYGVTNKLITAPEGTAYLIINDRNGYTSFYGDLIMNVIDRKDNAILSKVNSLEEYTKYDEAYTGWNDSDISVENGFIYASDGTNANNNNYRRTSYIPVSVGDKFDYTLWGNNSTCAVVYGYDATKTPVANSGIAGTSNVYSVGTYTVPSGVAFIRFCTKADHMGTFNSQDEIKEKTYNNRIIQSIEERIDGIEGKKYPFASVFYDNFHASNSDWVDEDSAWNFDYENRIVSSTTAGDVRTGDNALVLNRKYIADMRIMSFRIKFGTSSVLDFGFINADGTYDGNNKITIDTANHQIKMWGMYNSGTEEYPLLIAKDISGFTIDTSKWYVVKIERNRLTASVTITDHITGENVELKYTFENGFFFDELCSLALVSGGNISFTEFDVSIMNEPYIYIVGDSITAYASAIGGWAQKFNDDLDNRLVISGRGNDTALSIATLIDTEVKYIKPKILMCCHGHNQGISATTIANIKTLCDEVGCKLYINHITCQNYDRQIERNAVIEASGFRGARFDIATARDGIPYIVPGDDDIRADSSLYKDGNVHPNMAGYAKMYARLRIDVPELFNQ